MIRITHPRPQAGRQKALGLEFIDGVAEVTEVHAERDRALRQHGFMIEGGDIIDLTSLSRRELRDIAEVEGIPVTAKMTRDQLIEAISSLPPEPIPGSTQNEDGSWTIEGSED